MFIFPAKTLWEPYVDKVKSVKNTGVFQPRWAIWREIWKWSCLPSILYCISRKTVDTEYTYYSWCMTSTDIVKWRKNEWLWKYWKRNDLYENFEKKGGGVVEKRGEEETKSMPHASVIHITNGLNFMHRKWYTGNQYMGKSAENRMRSNLELLRLLMLKVVPDISRP